MVSAVRHAADADAGIVLFCSRKRSGCGGYVNHCPVTPEKLLYATPSAVFVVHAHGVKKVKPIQRGRALADAESDPLKIKLVPATVWLAPGERASARARATTRRKRPSG